MRIIGIELRIELFTDKHGPEQKEIAIIPCNVDVVVDEMASGMVHQVYFNGTLHTSEHGDIAIPRFQVPVPSKYQHQRGAVQHRQS